MLEIKVNNGNIEDALKRFKRQCARNGAVSYTHLKALFCNKFNRKWSNINTSKRINET